MGTSIGSLNTIERNSYLTLIAASRENKDLDWCSVRPDSLIDAEVSPYNITESPVTGIFTGRPTTRANVAHFITKLIGDNELWSAWKFKMPVILNSQDTPPTGSLNTKR